MTENMKKYLELISKDEEAKKKMAGQENADAGEMKKRIIADAAERGIVLTEEDFAEMSELTEDALGEVAGGGVIACFYGGGSGSGGNGFGFGFGFGNSGGIGH